MNGATRMKTAYQSITLDERKRHFVFGDIHGRYTSFMRLLDKISYDPSTDVIYSVGDLIDRGPDAVLVVEFFKQEHCHAIAGNHEQMVLDHHEWEEVWMKPWNGGPATLRSLAEHGYELEWLRNFCAALPVCLDVGDEGQDSSFRLVHAESPFDWSESDLMYYLSCLDEHEAAEERLLWGRSDITLVLERELRASYVAANRSSRAVFCGHTPVTKVVSAFDIHWIDTFEGGVMTCIDPFTMQTYQQPIDKDDGLLIL